MKNLVAIAIPALLLFLMIVGIGGKGFVLIAAVLLIPGAYALLTPMPTSKRRIVVAMTYYFALVGAFFLFS